MSDRITSKNLEAVVMKNKEIHDFVEQKVFDVWNLYNPTKIPSPAKLALQILQSYGLILFPIDDPFFSGAIFIRNDRKIPVINTALPRVNQYFAAWHEVYHIYFDEVSLDHYIDSDIVMEERKAEHFAALMLLGEMRPYYDSLPSTDFLSKVFYCMSIFQAPYKAVLLNLYEIAMEKNDIFMKNEIKDIFDAQYNDIEERFRYLGLDDDLVRPSYINNLNSLRDRIQQTINSEPDVRYHGQNLHFLELIQEKTSLRMGVNNG